MTHPTRVPMLLVIALISALVLGPARGASAKDAPKHADPRRPLDGTWRVEVTVVDCATGAAHAPFWSLVTFARDGTVTDTTANQAFPGARTSGHGLWWRQGREGYAAATEAFILFGPALRPWVHRIDQTIEMTGANTFSSEAKVSFALVPGLLPAPPAPLPATPICASAQGYRF